MSPPRAVALVLDDAQRATLGAVARWPGESVSGGTDFEE
jgi:hypothetical protein